MKIKSISVLKQIAGVLLLLVAFSTNVKAQDKMAGSAKLITDNMKTQFALSDAQYKTMYITNLDFLNQLKALKKSGAAKNEKALKLKTLDQARDVKVKAILTPQQFAVYQAKKKENKEKLKAYVKKRKAEKKAAKK